MRKTIGTAVRRAIALAVVVFAAGPTIVRAQDDYSDKDFSLRLASAFIRFTEVNSAGGQTVANRWSSAINPAATGWTPIPSKMGFVVSPYYSHIRFKNGTRLNLTGESFTWDTGEWGAFQPTASQIRSNRAVDNQGLIFDYKVDTYQLQWGKRFGSWGIGATANYTSADVVNDLDTPFGRLRASDSHAASYRFRLGALYQPAERLLAGLMVEYGASPYRATALAMGPRGPIIGQTGPVMVKLKGTLQQVIVRPGVSYEYADYSTVYLDYQLGHFWSKRGTLNHHLLVAGVDHRILEPLFVRAAVSVDGRGNAAYTCGVGAYVSRWCSIDLGYHYDILPDLQPEFGRAHVGQLTVSGRF